MADADMQNQEKPQQNSQAKVAGKPDANKSAMNPLSYIVGIAIALVVLAGIYFVLGTHSAPSSSTTIPQSTVHTSTISVTSSVASTLPTTVVIASNAPYSSLITTDAKINASKTLIVVATRYDNAVEMGILAGDQSLNSSFGPRSVIVKALGTDRILVLGYNASDTAHAGAQFATDLKQAKQTSPGRGLSYHNVTILNLNGQAVAQVVVGTYATQTDIAAAEGIALTIRNYSSGG